MSHAVDAPPGSGSASKASSSARVRLRGFERSQAQIRNRGKRTTAAILSFGLSKQARLVLLVRGPGPSCKLAGRIPIAGRRGLNRFPFDGTIGNRRLKPGTYSLTIRAKGTNASLAQTFVTVIAPGHPVKKRIRPECSVATNDLAGLAAFGPLTGFPGSDFFDDLSGTSSNAGTAPEAETPLSAAETQGAGVGGVLGERTPGTGTFPDLPLASPGTASGLISLLLLVLFLGSLAALLVAAVQHRRRRDDRPS
jgi:hypothetical protein